MGMGGGHSALSTGSGGGGFDSGVPKGICDHFQQQNVCCTICLINLIHRKSTHVRCELQRGLVALFSTVENFTGDLYRVKFYEKQFLRLDLFP